MIFHTGYNPDITLLLRQAREQGLKFGALVGHGAGYGVYEKLKEGLGGDVNYFFNTDPISIWLANEKGLDPKLPPVIKMIGEEFDKVKPGVAIRSAHVGIAASNTYVFMTEVLPRAIKKYGGVDPEALRKAALEVDLPEGGTMLGFGVKFFGDGPDGRAERTLVPGGHPVCRRQVVCGVAEEPGATRGRAAAAGGLDLQQQVDVPKSKSRAGQVRSDDKHKGPSCW